MKAQATRAGGKFLALVRGAYKPKPPRVTFCPPGGVPLHFDLYQFFGKRPSRWRDEGSLGQ